MVLRLNHQHAKLQSALVGVVLSPGPWLALWGTGLSSSPPLSRTNSHHDFVCIFYINSSLYNHKVTIQKGKWIPARTKGSGWPASALSLGDVVITQLSLPWIPLKGKGPWELISGAVLGGGKHPLPFAPFHMPQAGMWKAAEPLAPNLAGLYICMAHPIVFICVGILKWLDGSESPHTVPTQNLSVFQGSLPAQMAGMWLPVYFRAAMCSYKAQHALLWRSWHKGLPFQTTSYCCVFYSLLQSLPCSSCPVRILSFSS